MHPLHNLTRALRKRISIRIRTSNAVEFKDRRHPRERACGVRDAMVDFDMCMLCVDACVEVVVCGH